MTWLKRDFSFNKAIGSLYNIFELHDKSRLYQDGHFYTDNFLLAVCYGAKPGSSGKKGDSAKFTLGNTADSATLKIKEILNPYLPKEDQLYGNAEQIEQERKCIHDIK